MDLHDLTTDKKALTINLDDARYGTFAEIGAGQEVARHFFVAGRASHTIAKTISAYDMTFSDEIYGRGERYVSQTRVIKMLDHEYSLVQERLNATRGANTCFFAFADTVATSSQQETSHCHGWLGVRFQTKPGGPANEIILHVRLLDRFRLQQQEALGILGVNLLYAAFYQTSSCEEVIRALTDQIGNRRVEINMIRFSGQGLEHIDNRIASLELVRQKLTNAVMFAPDGNVLQASDALYRKPVLVQRGTFRPVTKTNIEILEHGLKQFKKHPQVKDHEPLVLMEITMDNLSEEGQIDQNDFLNRVDTLCSVGHHVLISNFVLFYQLKTHLRTCTDQVIGIVIGASHLEKLFDENHYKNLPGGILEGFSRLFDDKTLMFVFPYKSDNQCMTSQTYHPGGRLEHLYQYLLKGQSIQDLADCDNIDTSIHSKQVREMLASGNKDWEKLVPPSVRDLIKKLQLFDYKP